MCPHQQAERPDLFKDDRSARTLGEIAQKYRNGEISRDEYDQWRYRYPRSEAEMNNLSHNNNNNNYNND